MSTTFTEGRHTAEFILNEDEGFLSRDNITIAANQTIVPGQVLGMVPAADSGAVTVGAPGFAGTGGGTLTKAGTPYAADVKEGTYKVICVETTTAGGQFEVIRPDGTVDGSVLVGVAYDGQVKFTIADGSPDFLAGDTFTLAVSIADAADKGQYKAWDPDATDGTQTAVAIAIYGVTTVSDTPKIAAITRLAEVNKNLLTWHSGASAPQLAAGVQQLAAKTIIAR